VVQQSQQQVEYVSKVSISNFFNKISFICKGEQFSIHDLLYQNEMIIAARTTKHPHQ
jgi:hypothetical protein